MAALSCVGAANMTLGALRQLGVIGHLPDPPIRGFDSNAVIMSRAAFVLGVPDAPVAVAGLLANVPLSLIGGGARARERPWVPIAIAAKAVVEVSVAAWYLVMMRTRVDAWCAYCLVGASLYVAIAFLAAREASAALGTPKMKLVGALGAAVLAGLTIGVMRTLDARQRST